MAKKEQRSPLKQSFLEANHALLQAHSLANIGQGSYTDPEDEDIYNLLGVIEEKIDIVREFLNDNEVAFDKICD